VRTHPATIISHGELEAEIDIELAPLILEIWRAGITTIHSCQDVGENVSSLVADLPHLAEMVRRETGRASIGFREPQALLAVLDALARAGPRDQFYERMVHWATPDAWQLVIAVQDQGLQPGTSPSPALETESRLTAVSYQLRFPRTDVGEMVVRTQRYNRSAGVHRPPGF